MISLPGENIKSFSRTNSCHWNALHHLAKNSICSLNLFESVLFVHPHDELPALGFPELGGVLPDLLGDVTQTQFGGGIDGGTAKVLGHVVGHRGEGKVDVGGLVTAQQELATVRKLMELKLDS